jgi:hypothetical protein
MLLRASSRRGVNNAGASGSEGFATALTNQAASHVGAKRRSHAGPSTAAQER